MPNAWAFSGLAWDVCHVADVYVAMECQRDISPVCEEIDSSDLEKEQHLDCQALVWSWGRGYHSPSGCYYGGSGLWKL